MTNLRDRRIPPAEDSYVLQEGWVNPPRNGRRAFPLRPEVKKEPVAKTDNEPLAVEEGWNRPR